MGTDARLKILVDLINNSKKELAALKKDLGEVDTSAKKADKGMSAFTQKIIGMATVAGAVKLTKMIYELGEMGAQAYRVEAGFEKMAGGTGQAALVLAALKEATMGTKSEQELMAGATNILALGLADNADQLSGVVRNVEALGSRFGGTMQTFQLMMSNQSLMRIDSFGLSIAEVTKRIDEYKAAGKSAEDAFKMAVMDAMNDKFAQLGGNIDDATTAILRNEAALADLKTEAGKAYSGFTVFASGLIPFVSQLKDLLGVTNDVRQEYGFLRGTWAGFVESIDILDILPTLIDKQEEHTEALRAAATETERYNGLVDYYASIQANATEVTSAYAGAWDSVAGAIARQDTEAMDAITLATQREGDAAANAAIANMNFAASISEMSEADFATATIDLMTAAMIAAGKGVDEIKVAMQAILIEFGLLTPAEEKAEQVMGNFAARMAENGADVEMLAAAIHNVQKYMESLEDKEVTLTVNTNFNTTGGTGGYVDPGTGSGYGEPFVPPPPPSPGGDVARLAVGGYLPAGMSGFVGERGPEWAQATSAGVRVTPLTQVDRSINLGGVTINTQSGAQAAMRQLSQMEF